MIELVLSVGIALITTALATVMLEAGQAIIERIRGGSGNSERSDSNNRTEEHRP